MLVLFIAYLYIINPGRLHLFLQLDPVISHILFRLLIGFFIRFFCFLCFPHFRFFFFLPGLNVPLNQPVDSKRGAGSQHDTQNSNYLLLFVHYFPSFPFSSFSHIPLSYQTMLFVVKKRLISYEPYPSFQAKQFSHPFLIFQLQIQTWP